MQLRTLKYPLQNKKPRAFLRAPNIRGSAPHGTNRLITTAIEYPDGKPHLGHAYEKFLADFLARHRRLNGDKVILSVGLDEHSPKVVAAAQAAGQEPKEFCDDLEIHYRDTWSQLGISADYFIRTSSAEHVATVKKILTLSHAQGDIYRGTYSRAFCAQCGVGVKPDLLYSPTFKEKRCRNHWEQGIVYTDEPSYFFRTTKYLPEVGKHIADNVDFIRGEKYRGAILNQLTQTKPADLDISRSNLSWGIPLPFDASERTYVWFDALCNYLTVAGYGWDQARFDSYWPASLHVIGKDIVRHHAVLWPAILKSVGLPLPERLLVHGLILGATKEKLSKSNGDATETLSQPLAEYGLEPLRWYLASRVQLIKDEPFSLERLAEIYERDLVKHYAHLLPWVETLAVKYLNGRVSASQTLPRNEEFLAIFEKYQTAMNNDDTYKGANQALELILFLNRYLPSRTKSQQQLKPEFEATAETEIRLLLEMTRLTALALWPFMPQTAQTTLERIGIAGAPRSGSSLWEKKWIGNWVPQYSLTLNEPLFETKKPQRTVPVRREPEHAFEFVI